MDLRVVADLCVCVCVCVCVCAPARAPRRCERAAAQHAREYSKSQRVCNAEGRVRVGGAQASLTGGTAGLARLVLLVLQCFVKIVGEHVCCGL